MVPPLRTGLAAGDLLAGVTVAAYLVPQVMGYAEVAGLPSAAGLWAAIGLLVVYAVLGSSKHLSVGSESTTALMTAVVLGPIAAAFMMARGKEELRADLAAAGLLEIIDAGHLYPTLPSAVDAFRNREPTDARTE